MESKGKSTLIVLAVIIGLVITFALAYWWKRGAGVWVVSKTMLTIALVLVLLGLVIYVVWLIFKKTQVDAVKLNKDRILKSCLVNIPPFKQQLYFKGSEEWENHKVGVICGICQIKVKRQVGINEIKTVRDGQELTLRVPTYDIQNEDCIAFKRTTAFFFSWFLPYNIVRVSRDERTSLNSDIVFLKSMSFTPELYGFLYLPTRYRDTQRIDKVVTEEVHRYTLQHLLKEQINIVEESLAISPRHQKELEKQNTQMIPVMPQQQGGGK